ncbi:MAG: elongation factor G [Planctomycetota bacterium]
MPEDLKKLRNIGIMAHIDAGKTTVTERVLYYTGKIYKMGEVHEGTTTMDYLEEEQQRGITITSAATRCPWKESVINLIDTPGHVDFTAEVERSLRVLDGAVAVFDASEGVQAQTETVWRQGRKYSLACLCFVNKMDKVGADFEMTVESIRDKLVANPVALQIPIGAESGFEGLIDLVEMKAVFYKPEVLGARYDECEIPRKYMEEAKHWREIMIESMADMDDELAEAFMDDGPMVVEMLRRVIRKGTVAARINPVFVGSALKYIGVQRLLDGVVAYLPSPVDRPAAKGHKLGKEEEEVMVKCDRGGSLVAMVFKITSDQHGDLNFLRIYRGVLKSGSRVLNSSRGGKENITRIFEMHAESRRLLDYASAGDIVAVVGLKNSYTGDTICDTRNPVILERIKFPEAVIDMSIEPRTSGDREKLSAALSLLRREDPTFSSRYNSETGETIISGMGELHLEVLEHRLVRDLKVGVRVGKPRVAYKETITEVGESEGRFVQQSGGRGQYGHVVVRVESFLDENGQYNKTNQFENSVVGGAVPKEYIGGVEEGVYDALSSGPLGGYPLVGVKVTLLDGSYHSVDSSEIAFERAAAIATNEAIKKAHAILLEPIMRVQVVIPEENYGAVQGSLVSKRGEIFDSRPHGHMRVLDVRVPLGEMFGYSSEIRGLTRGRGTFAMEPSHYQRVPEQISEKILSTFS